MEQTIKKNIYQAFTSTKSIKKYIIFSLFIYLLVFSTTAIFAKSFGYKRTMSIGGSGSDTGYSVTVDTDGNRYITGNFQGTGVDFNKTGKGSPDLKISNGMSDVFVTKIDSNGNYISTLTFGGTGDDYGLDVTTDAAGNLFVTGIFQGTNVDFNTTGTGGSDLKSSNGSFDIFLTKINSNGTYGYTYVLGGSSVDVGRAVTTDSFGNVYFTGYYRSANTNFNTTGSGTPDVKSAFVGTHDVYLTKINFDGSYGFTRTIGGLNQDEGYDVVTDSNNLVYLTGFFFSSNTNFNTTGVGSPDYISPKGSADIFVTKFSTDGDYISTNTIGGSSVDYPVSATIDVFGNFYLTGNFESTNVNFNLTGVGDPDVRSTNGSRDVFLTKINADESYGYTHTWGGSDVDYGNAVFTDKFGQVYVGGFYRSPSVNFNNTGAGTNDIRQNNGLNDAFVTNFNSDGSYGYTYTFGGTSFDTLNSLVGDNKGNIFMTGYYRSPSVNFNTSGTGLPDNQTTDGTNTIFVTEIKDQGSKF